MRFVKKWRTGVNQNYKTVMQSPKVELRRMGDENEDEDEKEDEDENERPGDYQPRIRLRRGYGATGDADFTDGIEARMENWGLRIARATSPSSIIYPLSSILADSPITKKGEMIKREGVPFLSFPPFGN
jgi:hypothetical protein